MATKLWINFTVLVLNYQVLLNNDACIVEPSKALAIIQLSERDCKIIRLSERDYRYREVTLVSNSNRDRHFHKVMIDDPRFIDCCQVNVNSFDCCQWLLFVIKECVHHHIDWQIKLIWYFHQWEQSSWTWHRLHFCIVSELIFRVYGWNKPKGLEVAKEDQIAHMPFGW